MPSISEVPEAPEQGLDRRKFMAVTGTALAVTGVAGILTGRASGDVDPHELTDFVVGTVESNDSNVLRLKRVDTNEQFTAEISEKDTEIPASGGKQRALKDIPVGETVAVIGPNAAFANKSTSVQATRIAHCNLGTKSGVSKSRKSA